MFPRNLAKACCALCFSVALYTPASVAAPIVAIDFDSVIIDVEGPSPLNTDSLVHGHIEVDSDDQVGSYTQPFFAEYQYFGSLGNTHGVAHDTSGSSWSQGPDNSVSVRLTNNYTIQPGELDDLPSFVDPLTAPEVGDVVDMVEFQVQQRIGSTDEYFLFDILFVFNADTGDDIVTGLGMGDVDFSRLYEAFYMEFNAEHWLDDGSEDGFTYWEAIGPVTDLNVVASPVPVPAAVWLFGSGLLGLIGFSKKRLS